MPRWLLVLVLASCRDPGARRDAGSGPDTASGSPSLTVNVRAMVGMVVSAPAGIRCGTCQTTQTGGTPCPPGARTDRACTSDFAAGTRVTLSLVGQDTYTDYVCAEEPANTVRPCEIVISTPIMIGVWGEVK
jgi:hypothetical protein